MKDHIRAITPDRTGAQHSGLARRSYHLRTLFRAAIGSLCLLSLFLFSAARVSAQHYQQTNLVSDVPGLAPVTDPNLVNPWGLDASAGSAWWVSDNGKGRSTLYNGAGQKLALVVTVAPPPGSTDPSTPTGIVANSTTSFQLTPGVPGSAARFIFVTEDGTISGWNPSVNATNSVIKVNHAGAAIYKGVAIAQVGTNNFLYVANFLGGRVDVFDANYSSVTLPSGAFVDPNIPAGYAPFNVQNINGNVYVAFAKQNDDGDEEVQGPKLGYVDSFDGSGTLLQRFEHHPSLNAPWGLAMAPASGFGKASGKLLVGMFGSGEIATFDPATGFFEGLLRDRHGKPIQIDGLWALRFGKGNAGSGSTTSLYFTAGIEDEAHGLFGTITAIPKKNGDDDDQ